MSPQINTNGQMFLCGKRHFHAHNPVHNSTEIRQCLAEFQPFLIAFDYNHPYDYLN